MTDETSPKVVSIREAVKGARPARALRTPKPKEPRADDPSTWLMTPLGVHGDTHFWLDGNGQLVTRQPNQYARLWLMGLAAPHGYMIEKCWPRYGRPDPETGKSKILGPDYEKAGAGMMNECARRGVWNPFNFVRGRGSWLGEDGELVLHLGSVVRVGAELCEPGLIGRYVYPKDSPMPQPWDSPVATIERGRIRQFLKLLESWKWVRGELDARLLLGWIGAAMLAGAIAWRPVVWITGGKGTGKSTLQKMIARIFDGALVAVTDTSAAGIWQKLGYATLPVVLDEIEAEEDNRRGQSLIKLARQAASGGLVLRGGADHGATEFVARSCFLFSSILVPPLLAQDRSRMAILGLNPLDQGAESPDLHERELRELGQQLLRRVVDGWDRWNDTLAAYRTGLMTRGHDARSADLFGTLLAAADLLLSDGEPHADFISALADQLDVGALADSSDDATDEERCKEHLLSKAIPLDGMGARRAVAEWLRRAAGLATDDELHSHLVINEARSMLTRYGLDVKDVDGRRVMAVASNHAELAKLFADTHWAARSGGVGVWTQALRRLPGAHASRKTLWFGTSCKGTLLPLENMLSDPEPGDLPRTAADAHGGLWERP